MVGVELIILHHRSAANGPDGSIDRDIRLRRPTPASPTRNLPQMSSPDDPARDDGVVAAAGRVALYPARAAMRASRTRIEASVESVLTGPELARIVDAVLAGPFPEELAQILVERKVIERIAAKIATDVQFADVIDQVLARPDVREAVAKAVGSDATHELIRRTLEQQTSSVAADLSQALRVRTRALDARVDLRRPPAPARFGGVATRAIALTADALLISLIALGVSTMVTLIASLVGTLRPAWLVGLLLASGWTLLFGVYFAGFWSLAGQTPGMRLMHVRVRGPGGAPLSLGRSLVRVVGLAAAIIPCFAGFVPALFDGRRRALPDFVAGTTVEVDGSLPDDGETPAP
jgi:uncharacterized RDD family membrane protein YckC